MPSSDCVRRGASARAQDRHGPVRGPRGPHYHDSMALGCRSLIRMARGDVEGSLTDRMRVALAAVRGGTWRDAAEAVVVGDFESAARVLDEIGAAPHAALARLRAARALIDAGRRAEGDVQLQRALTFWRSVGATRYVREGEALLAASA